MGPFVGFRISYDYGRSWTDTKLTPENNLFRENAKEGNKVKMGAPHFVDFGKNMEHSPDGKAYLVGHGAPEPDPKPRFANLSWITGDQVYLLRVTPTIENINDAAGELLAQSGKKPDELCVVGIGTPGPANYAQGIVTRATFWTL